MSPTSGALCHCRSGYVRPTCVTLLVKDATTGGLSIALITRGRNPVYMASAVTPSHHRHRRLLPQSTATTAAPDPITYVFEVHSQIHYFFYQEPNTEAYVAVFSLDGQLLHQHTLTMAELQLDHIRRCSVFGGRGLDFLLLERGGGGGGAVGTFFLADRETGVRRGQAFIGTMPHTSVKCHQQRYMAGFGRGIKRQTKPFFLDSPASFPSPLLVVFHCYSGQSVHGVTKAPFLRCRHQFLKTCGSTI